ncbi:MAG: helix-turn-helix domain-containing protein [Bacillota bacterium]|nr:helix-turn-helix domain-containing protein [Bacillota bacterium]
MKIFAIRDENDKSKKDIAYLLYYEVDKRFYIELKENADPWETPLILSAFAKRGERTINSYWSKLWVQQRIVPPDRQNIGQILKDNGLKTYDEFELLLLASGRCEQDDYYLVPINLEELPKKILARLNRKIEDIVPLSANNLLVFFCDGTIKKCDLNEYFKKTQHFDILLKHTEYFNKVKIQAGGYGVSWDENLFIPDSILYSIGKKVPLTADDFKSFASERIVNSAEVAELLNCSRQYVNELVKTDKLHPIKTSEKNTLFLKSEVLKRLWQ